MVKWNAADYAKNSSAQLGWAQELIGKLGLVGSERVLDLGCGDGKISAEIARLVPRGKVIGVDKSCEMIEFASNAFPNDRWPNLRFWCADASELEFRDEFDVVFSNATLHWVKDHQPVLLGIARALKPRGRILLQMGGRGNAAAILNLMEEFRAKPRWSGYFGDFQQPYGFYGPEEYEKWLPDAGLKADRVELIPKDMIQQGRDGLAGWVRTTWLPYTQRVPEEEREEFVDEIVTRYIDQNPPDAAGNVHVRMVRLEVEAVRQAGRSGANGLWILG